LHLRKSLEPIIDSKAEILILGSMPGEQSLAKQQDYANPRNHFWKLIFAIFDISPIDNYHDKLKFLREKKIALWDVLRFCERTGSLDSGIKNEVTNEFEPIIATHPRISHIFFNGTKAKRSFEKHLDIEKFKGIRFYLLPSSSPTPGKNVKTFEEKLEDWMIIKRLLRQ
jgi:hypoxanthine-DNA glycosylase